MLLYWPSISYIWHCHGHHYAVSAELIDISDGIMDFALLTMTTLIRTFPSFLSAEKKLMGSKMICVADISIHYTSAENKSLSSPLWESYCRQYHTFIIYTQCTIWFANGVKGGGDERTILTSPDQPYSQ